MLKNVYAPLSGGTMQEHVIEIISNNLANVNTTGFKEDEISFEKLMAEPWHNYPTPLPPASFKLDMSDLYPLHGNEMSYVALSEIKTSHTQGPLVQTGNDTDIAIEGAGYLEVMTPFGERYTRDGSFSISNDGVLVTKNGHVVQGENGAISNLSNEKLSILPTGEVYSGKTFIDKIKVVAFEDENTMERLGQNLWVHTGDPRATTPFKGRVNQHYLEGSNVNPMKNLTNLIVAHRSYEALQKAIHTQDESMGMANKIAQI